MSNSLNHCSWIESVQNLSIRGLRCLYSILPCLPRNHQIHPLVKDLSDSTFIYLSSKKRVRVIHIDYTKNLQQHGDTQKHSDVRLVIPDIRTPPENLLLDNGPKVRSYSVISNISEQSSEDYWFTQSNRPLKMPDACSCSFRKSWRLSLNTASTVLDTDNVINTDKNDFIYRMSPNESKEIENEACSYSMNVVKNYVDLFIEKVIEEAVQVAATINFKHMSIAESSSNFSFNIDKYSSSETIHCCSISPQKLSTRTKIFKIPSKDRSFVIKEVLDDISELKSDMIEICVGEGFINPAYVAEITDPELFDSNDHAELPVDEMNLPILDESPIECFNFKTSMRKSCLSLDSTSVHKTTASKHGNLHSSLIELSSSRIANDANFTKINEHCNNQNSSSFLNVNNLQSNTQFLKVVSKKDQDAGNFESSNKACKHSVDNKRLKPVLFFLHGVGASADIWYRLLRYFSNKGYEVVAPDMLGHGYSSAPHTESAYKFQQLLNDVLYIFDKYIGENKKCVVIGHAYGCSLAAALSKSKAQQIKQLVFISGGGPTPLAPHRIDKRPADVPICLQACMKPLLMCGCRRDLLYAPYGKNIVPSDPWETGVPPYVLEYVAKGQDWPEGDSTFHRRILVPTLLVHGLQDPYITLVQECEMERTIPRSFLEVIPNAGHFAMLETPTKLSHMIHCFIDWWNK